MLCLPLASSVAPRSGRRRAPWARSPAHPRPAPQRRQRWRRRGRRGRAGGGGAFEAAVGSVQPPGDRVQPEQLGVDGHAQGQVVPALRFLDPGPLPPPPHPVPAARPRPPLPPAPPPPPPPPAHPHPPPPRPW